MKRFIKIIAASTFIGLFLYTYLFFSETGNYPVKQDNFPDLLFIIGVSNLAGFCLFYFNQFLCNSNYLKKRNFSRILFGIVLNFLLIILVCSLCFGFYSFAYTKFTYSEFYNMHAGAAVRFYILTFVTVFLFVLVDFSIRSFQQFQKAKVLSVQIAREQSELQLDAFKMQLSPHFLFNNLNTLSHLIYQNPSTTEKYIRNLTKTYDYILKNSHLDLVPLQEEIEFIKAYSFLLNIRFQDSLDISIEAEKAEASYLLPPLSLQLLVENAVKHNVASPNEKLKVELKLDKNYVEVKNNMLKSPKNLISSKLGLKNLKRRYSFFSEKLVEILINCLCGSLPLN
jgi:two-component system LytT family sensor kinase